MREDPSTLTLPSLGSDMDVGTVIEWKVAVGDRVERGDDVAVVETEKSDIDVETWSSGVVVELLAPLGCELDVGTPLLRLDLADTTSPTGPRPPVDVAPPARDEDPPDGVLHGRKETRVEAPSERQEPTRDVAAHLSAARPHASPLARRIANERGIDLAEISGSGPSGAVLSADLEELTSDVTPQSDHHPLDRPDRAARRRAVIAERMQRSNDEIPHYRLERDIDLGPALGWLADHNESRDPGERLLPAALLLCASARAAHEVSDLNGIYDAVAHTTDDVHLAFVVNLRTEGIVAPTIPNAHRLGSVAMMKAIKEIVPAARRGALRSEWTGAASITVTQLGELGADRVSGLIFPPQLALVGFGRIVDRPWVVDGELGVRPIVTASLAADHRATDGAVGSRYLALLAGLLADPAQLASTPDS